MKGAPDCASARCGLEAGCRKEPDGSFICICTHDLSVAKPDLPCPRRVGMYTYRNSLSSALLEINNIQLMYVGKSTRLLVRRHMLVFMGAT